MGLRTENVQQIFTSTGFPWLFYQYLHNKCTFCWNQSSSGAATFVCLSVKNRQGWYTTMTCQTQAWHLLKMAIFTTSVFPNVYQSWPWINHLKNCCKHVFIPLLSVGPTVLLHLVSPLIHQLLPHCLHLLHTCTGLGHVTPHWHQQEHQGYIKMFLMCCIIMWGLSSSLISPLRGFNSHSRNAR